MNDIPKTTPEDVIAKLEDACAAFVSHPIDRVGMDDVPLLARISSDRYVLRRILAARAIIDPVTGNHVWPWRRLATCLGADVGAMKRWHTQGVSMIVASLNAEREASVHC